MIEPPMTSGFVARTTPSVRCGSGAPKISSDGRLGMWTMPSTVSKRAAMNFVVGSSPTVRSVPGPSKRSASKRRSVTRSAAPTSGSARSLHAATGSSSSRRQTCRICSPRRASASSRARSGWTCWAQPQRRVRHDRPVRRALVDDDAGLAHEGQLVAAGAAGVEVVEQPGRGRARQPDARAALARRARGSARRTRAARSRASPRRRARIRARLTCMSKYWTSTNLAPCR